MAPSLSPVPMRFSHHCSQFLYIKDFKMGHYGRLGRLDRCHITQNTRDILLSSFWDGMFSPSSVLLSES